MPYIGKSPVGGGFHKLDNLTASATATYALTLGSAAYYPETANQLLVSLNGVIQAPQDSFTVSGSNLIFDSALTASDSIDFVVALGDVLGVQGVTDGAVSTNKIANGAVTKAKIGTTELDLATIKDSTGTNTAMTIDSAGITTNSVPVGFSAKLQGNQSGILDATYTKIEMTSTGAYNFDTHNGWSNTDYYYTVPANCAGYWMLTAQTEFDAMGTSNLIIISKTATVGDPANWTAYHNEGQSSNGSPNPTPNVTCMAYLNVGDIIKAEARHNYGTTRNLIGASVYLRTFMQGWRLF